MRLASVRPASPANLEAVVEVGTTATITEAAAAAVVEAEAG